MMIMMASMCGTTMIDPEIKGGNGKSQSPWLVALSVFRASLEVGEFSAHGLTHLPWLR